ncbi:hypothetical protein M0R45_019490 [Rubus argutus]|uniref:Kri1-like C-terminal domain-containing protein n=1 Tax=Rubus argutus TaxID=59490 RepID=A0AAW1X7G1_RUBAR
MARKRKSKEIEVEPMGRKRKHKQIEAEPKKPKILVTYSPSLNVSFLLSKKDELLGLPKGWESVGSGDGFLAARENILKLKKSDGDYKEKEEEEDEVDKEEVEKVSEEVKQEKKRKLAILERAKKEMMDEYYKLDYEDTIGDLRTRFKYAKIKPNRYGLSTATILMVDEKELNQYVPLKKLAPFKETEWKVSSSKRNEIKKRVKEIYRQDKMGFKKNRKRLRKEEDAKHSNSTIGAAKHEQEQVGDSNGDKSKLSRNARRRRHQTEQKLPISRLMAYGVMPSESKKKAKH